MAFTEIITIYSPTSNMQGCLATHTLPPNCVSSRLLVFASLRDGKCFLSMGILFCSVCGFFLLCERFFICLVACMYSIFCELWSHVWIFLLDSSPLCWIEIVPQFFLSLLTLLLSFYLVVLIFCLNAVKYVNTWFYDFWILHHG